MLSKFGLTPYEDPAVEAAFQERYFQHGRNSVLVFCFLVFFLAGTTLLRDFFLENPDKFVMHKQLLRIVVCLIALSFFAILFLSKNLSANYFKNIQIVLAGFVTLACFFLAYIHCSLHAFTFAAEVTHLCHSVVIYFNGCGYLGFLSN
jgi:hypothetical protein